MPAEAIDVFGSISVIVGIRLPATSLPGDANARQLRNIGGDLSIGENLRYDGAATDPTETTVSPRATVRKTVTVPGGGSVDIDLSSVDTVQGFTEDLNGKKLVAAQFKAHADNAAAVTVKPGSSNGYPLFGTGQTQGLVMAAAQTWACWFAENNAAAVNNSTKKILTISGTANAVLDVLLVFAAA